MLIISNLFSAAKAQAYYAKEFAAAEQNCWRPADKIQDEWRGKLAQKFGLTGAVGAEAFARLSEGQHPHTGEQLVRHRAVYAYRTKDGRTVATVAHRAAWDATFTAPKSVSLTALVGGDDRVREAHREAVACALSAFERYTQVRSAVHRSAETTGQFVTATFEHDTSRPVDGYAAPHLHTHAVIFNLTERANGTIRAVQPLPFFESALFATAIYESHLTYQLRALGYQIEPGKSGAPEIKGYSREYLDASSPRHQQIVEAVARSGFTGPKAAQIAAFSTRGRKQILSPDEALGAHRGIAAEFGNQADQVVAQARWRRQGERHGRSAEESKQLAHSVLTYARDCGFEREAVLDERTLFVYALRRAMGETTYSEVRVALESRIESGEFCIVAGQKHSPSRRITTSEAIGAEKEILREVLEGRGCAPQLMPVEQVIPLTESHLQLNPAQRNAIEQILTSRDQVQGLQGSAGVGKTASLAVIRDGAEQNSYTVVGFAPTPRAARQLRAAGIDEDTLQDFLARTRRAGDPEQRHLYMVDESSLASTLAMRDFLLRIGRRDKVLLIGNIWRHQGVEAGRPFKQLQAAGMQTVRLDSIIPDRDPQLLKAVEHLGRNESQIGLQMLQQQGRVTEIADPEQRIAAIAKSYAVHPENTVIVSPDNASRRAINQSVRRQLQARGFLDANDLSVRVLTPRSDVTGPDRARAGQYQAGDVLHYVRGSKEHAIGPGSYAEVVRVDPRKNLVTVRKENGEQVTYRPSRLYGISTYREIERDFAIGEKIQLTAPIRALAVGSHDLGTLQRINRDGTITVRMHGDKAKFVTFDPMKMRHFDHGYAVSPQSSRSLTSERVLVNIDTDLHPQLINPRFAYVALSRASHDAQIFTNNEGALANRMRRDVTKTSALQIGNQAPPPSPRLPEQQLPTPKPAMGHELSL
jgi:conjugative relaxase-like TrwC/TraI family protein